MFCLPLGMHIHQPLEAVYTCTENPLSTFKAPRAHTPCSCIFTLALAYHHKTNRYVPAYDPGISRLPVQQEIRSNAALRSQHSGSFLFEVS